jgi:Flavodoxin
MKPILVLYATREGQTRRIANHIWLTLQELGLPAKVMDARALSVNFALSSFEAAIVAGSIHVGKHEPEIVRFVQTHCAELERMPTVFLSVSASQIGVEDIKATPENRARNAANVKKVIDEFLQETGWKPGRVLPVAGALMYRKYNFLVRMLMRSIARKEGASTDTSRDVEYTDWSALDRFVEDFARGITSSGVKQAA